MIIGFDQSNEARLAWEKAELNYSTVGLIQFAPEYSATCLTRRGVVWYGMAWRLICSLAPENWIPDRDLLEMTCDGCCCDHWNLKSLVWFHSMS